MKTPEDAKLIFRRKWETDMDYWEIANMVYLYHLFLFSKILFLIRIHLDPPKSHENGVEEMYWLKITWDELKDFI